MDKPPIEIPPGYYLIDFTVLVGDPVSEEKFRAAIASQHELSGSEESLSERVEGDSAADKAPTTTAD